MTTLDQRVVIDTNILISRLLAPHSIPTQAVRKAMHVGQMLASEATFEELGRVLSRPKFDRYVTLSEREAFMHLLERVVEQVVVVGVVRACRDPEDDKFLELAANGAADVIITGDQDLLILNTFRSIRIMTPVDYLHGCPTNF